MNKTPTLNEIIEPLLNFLERRYPQSEDHPFEAPWPAGDCDLVELRPNEIAIELVQHMPMAASRAIATLLELSDWSDVPNPKRPLRFKLQTSVASVRKSLIKHTFLIVDAGEDVLDVDAAGQQIACLIAHLESSKNLVKLNRQQQACLL